MHFIQAMSMMFISVTLCVQFFHTKGQHACEPLIFGGSRELRLPDPVEVEPFKIHTEEESLNSSMSFPSRLRPLPS
jgi:hypothetical protein